MKMMTLMAMRERMTAEVQERESLTEVCGSVGGFEDQVSASVKSSAKRAASEGRTFKRQKTPKQSGAVQSGKPGRHDNSDKRQPNKQQD